MSYPKNLIHHPTVSKLHPLIFIIRKLVIGPDSDPLSHPLAEAKALRKAALSHEGKDQEKLRNAASELAAFARSMPGPKLCGGAKEKDAGGSEMTNPKANKNGGGRGQQIEVDR